VTRPGLGVDLVTGVARSSGPRFAAGHRHRRPGGGGRPGGVSVGGVRNTVRQSGPLQHGVHPRRILLSLTPDAPGVPAQLATDQLGRRAGRARRARASRNEARVLRSKHVGHRAGHLLSHGVHRLGRR